MRERVSYGDAEALVPFGVLGVFKDARAGECGLRDDDGDVRVAGDDFPVAAGVCRRWGWWWEAVSGSAVFFVGRDGAGAGGEAEAEVVREGVHVREVPSFHDCQIEVAVEKHDVVVGWFLRHGWEEAANAKLENPNGTLSVGCLLLSDFEKFCLFDFLDFFLKSISERDILLRVLGEII